MAPSPRRAAIEDTFRSLGGVMAWLHSRLRSTFSEDGISMGQMGILRVIMKHGSATSKELADALQVTTGDVTGLVDKLEKAGLVTRRRSTRDRRVVHVEPTPKAHARFKELRDASIEQISQAFQGWSLAEIRDFERLLRKIASGPGRAASRGARRGGLGASRLPP